MRSAPRAQKGFTLIELLITIVIVAVLARIAIPAYMESVNKTKRAQAQAGVLSLAQAMERFFTQNNTYTGAANSSNVPLIFPAAIPTAGATFYTLTVVIPTGGASYTISATPTGTMATDRCGTFTYTSDGVQGLTGQTSGLVVADCWK
jgi:type IV pilus assembly protein PilE